MLAPFLPTQLRSLAAASLLAAFSLTHPVPANPQSKPDNSPANSPARSTIAQAKLAQNYGKLPLSFEANQGQSDPQVKFLSRGNGYSLFLTDRSAVLSLTKRAATGPSAKTASSFVKGHDFSRAENAHDLNGAGRDGLQPILSPEGMSTDTIEMQLANANPTAQVTGADQLPGHANYLLGNDPAKWHTAVPTYAKVLYTAVYPGIDLVYYGNQRQLEYDFVVAPHADPSRISLHFAGAENLKLTPNGDLEVLAKNGQIAFHKPVLYQTVNGQREPIEGRFSLQVHNNIGFSLGKYDPNRELIIDPTLAYSTYLGGSGTSGSNGGEGRAIAADAAGNVYVAGDTAAIDFPVTAGTLQMSPADGKVSLDQTYPFVAKLDPTGSKVLYATFLSGTGNSYGSYYLDDEILGITVDGSGDVYVAGAASSNDFPITPGAFQTSNKAYSNYGPNCFVTELNPAGTGLVYSTYIGGGGMGITGHGDACTQIAINGAGNAFVTGVTESGLFPLKGALIGTFPDASGIAAFVTEFAADGKSLVYSTFLGGSKKDYATSIALDTKDNAYVVGLTWSDDFPDVAQTNGFQQYNLEYPNGIPTGFIAKLNPKGSALLYADYLGGTGGADKLGDRPTSVAVDSKGDAYVAGITDSCNFPTTEKPYQTINKACYHGAVYPLPVSYTNAFVTKIGPTGKALVFSTYLGSSSGEVPSTGSNSIALDAAGNVYLTGTTYGIDFPTTPNAYQNKNNSAGHGPPLGFLENVYAANSNAFLTELSSTGKLLYSTYLGGSATKSFVLGGGFSGPYVADSGAALALDKGGNAYIAGVAQSFDFPVTDGAYQTSKTAQSNAFISKINFESNSTKATLTTLTSDGNPQNTQTKVTFTAFVEPLEGDDAGVPTGKVIFAVGGVSHPEALDSTGHASYAAPSIADGSHKVTASYSGDAKYSTSSDSLTEVIAAAAASIKIPSSCNAATQIYRWCSQRLDVLVLDAKGNPVPDALITFASDNSNIAYTDYYASTDFTGKASVGVGCLAVGSLKGYASVSGVNEPAYFTLKCVE